MRFTRSIRTQASLVLAVGALVIGAAACGGGAGSSPTHASPTVPSTTASVPAPIRTGASTVTPTTPPSATVAALDQDAAQIDAQLNRLQGELSQSTPQPEGDPSR